MTHACVLVSEATILLSFCGGPCMRLEGNNSKIGMDAVGAFEWTFATFE